MNHLKININISDKLYVRNPEQSALGQKIISNAIDLIDQLGFEVFTFKKLSNRIGSPESSIYRYFENKHMLLVYLTNWYWSWLEHKIVLATLNIDAPLIKMEKAIEILTQPVLVDTSISFINEVKLNRIIISESTKAIHTRDVDIENNKGYFETYKYMVNRVAGLVLELNPDCQYPRMLVSTIVEGAHQQRYFLEHLPELTDQKQEEDSIMIFYKKLLFAMIEMK